MKSNQIIEIGNIKRANSALTTLLERTKSENVGIGLFYGRPGLGKTRWALKTAIKNNYLYMRLLENMTCKTFLWEMLQDLDPEGKVQYAFGLSSTPSTIQLFECVLEILQTQANIVIIIDEIDYAFKYKKILATIRDFADNSFATFILIGMQNSIHYLRNLDAHYFDRCNGFCEFRPLSQDDTNILLDNVCDIKLDNDLKEFIHLKAQGTMRIVNKYIDVIEKIANRMKKQELNYIEIKDILTTIEPINHSIILKNPKMRTK